MRGPWAAASPACPASPAAPAHPAHLSSHRLSLQDHALHSDVPPTRRRRSCRAAALRRSVVAPSATAGEAWRAVHAGVARASAVAAAIRRDAAQGRGDRLRAFRGVADPGGAPRHTGLEPRTSRPRTSRPRTSRPRTSRPRTSRHATEGSTPRQVLSCDSHACASPWTAPARGDQRAGLLRGGRRRRARGEQ